MALVVYSARAQQDLLRVVDFLASPEGHASQRALGLISDAVGMLAEHPLIGRRVENDFRELIIAKGSLCYVALYRYDRMLDKVLVLALRHHRESGILDVLG